MEILSPSTAYYDLKPKFHVYEQSGVKEYWIVDPTEKSIEIFGNKEGSFHLLEKAVLKQGGDKNICSRLFSSLVIDLGKIFG
ncbi:hypothetical protein ES705_44779 [subsurface metagenome]